MKDDLSIVAIIPLYNGARWIERTIHSVLSQSVQPNEFIVVDDGSNDNGPEIVNDLAKQHAITFLRTGSNRGQSAARNYAASQSKSAFIALLDQDDRWYTNHLEVLRDAIARHEGLSIGWAYSDFDDIDEHGKMISRNFIGCGAWENPKRNLITLLFQGLVIQPSSTLISRKAFDSVGGFDERLSGYEDDDLFLRIFREGYENLFIPYSTSQWRIHAESSGSSERMESSLRYYVKKLLATYPDDRWRGHYYARDAIAPRFIETWLQMYDRAYRYRNYAKMKVYSQEANKLTPLLRRKRLLYRISCSLLQYPRLGRGAGRLIMKHITRRQRRRMRAVR